MAPDHPAFEILLRVLGERTGLNFPANRLDGASVGIGRAMKQAGVTDPALYLDLVQRDDRALDDLVVELTIGETYFFREPAQFEFIRREVLPEIRRRRGPDHVIRAWSVGCASGEEPYSLAMLFDQEGLGRQAHLLATDISRASLAKCQRAVYGSWSLRGEPGQAARPYLRSQGERYILDEKIRGRVTFDWLNLALDVYPSFATGTWGMDLILCRNVLIYFDPDTIGQVSGRLFRALAPGGWLLTASSDPPLGEAAPFATVVAEEGVFYRHPTPPPRETTKPDPVANESPAVPAPPARPARKTTRSATRGPARSDPAQALPPPPAPAPEDPVEAARAALARGDYDRAAELTEPRRADAAAAVLHVRALANLETARAERACAEAISRHPLAAELRYLHAVLLLELDRDPEAARALRRVIYLDRGLAMAHFTLGAVARRHGDWARARRAYRNALTLCAGRPPDEEVLLSEGEHAGRLAEAARSALAILEAAQETSA